MDALHKTIRLVAGALVLDGGGVVEGVALGLGLTSDHPAAAP